MRAPLKPGGGVRKGTPYAAPERVFELLEEALGEQLSVAMRAEALLSFEALVGFQRYFASSQSEPEMREQLEAVAVAGDALAVAANFFAKTVPRLEKYAEERYRICLPPIRAIMECG